MSTPRISPETRAAIVRLWTGGTRSHRKISRATGAHWQTIARVLRAEGLMGGRVDGKPLPDATPTAPSGTTFSRTESADSALVEYTSDERIRTLEDAIRYGEVDTTVWTVDRWEVASWESVLKVKKDGQDVPLRKNLWRVKLYLKRVLPKAIQAATEAIFARMREHCPNYAPMSRRPPRSSPHLLEIDLFDVHFGKLAWEPETGQSYDLKITEQVFRNAVDDLLSKASGFPIDRILIPVGNDFFHVDNYANTTTAGTPQDTDGRYQKIFVTGFMAMVWAIERALETSPVEVIWIPGNHDSTVSFHLAYSLAVWFRNHPDVSVDHGPKLRKYVRYGNCLIGFTHGNEEPAKALPGLMANEMRREWGDTTCHEWRKGHVHKSKVEMTVPVDTHDGVVIRTLRSLSATDAYHYRKGYGGPRSAEAYLMSKSDGYAGHFVANAR